MAPELARGARLARPASDLFSFGVIAYELLTGRLPAENPPILLRLQSGKRWFPPLAIACPALSAELGALVERCLDASPDCRPTPGELLAALRAPHPPLGASAGEPFAR
jgi:serine/threonine-protein kinase